MPELTFTITNTHLVAYQMFHTYASVSARRKRRLRPLVVTTLCVLLGLFYYFQDSRPIAFGFFAVGAIALFLYQFMLKKRYEVYYATYLDKQRGSDFRDTTTLRLTENGVESLSSNGQGGVSYNQVSELVALKEIYILRLKDGNALVIAREADNSSQEVLFMEELAARTELQVEDYSNYKWR